MRRSVVITLATAAAACGKASGRAYEAAIECYASQSAVYYGVRDSGMKLPAYQSRAAEAAIAIYRERARTLARLDGEDNDQVEADVKAYLANFAERYQAAPDKAVLDREVDGKLRACADTLA